MHIRHTSVMPAPRLTWAGPTSQDLRGPPSSRRSVTCDLRGIVATEEKAKRANMSAHTSVSSRCSRAATVAEGATDTEQLLRGMGGEPRVGRRGCERGTVALTFRSEAVGGERLWRTLGRGVAL